MFFSVLPPAVSKHLESKCLLRKHRNMMICHGLMGKSHVKLTNKRGSQWAGNPTNRLFVFQNCWDVINLFSHGNTRANQTNSSHASLEPSGWTN